MYGIGTDRQDRGAASLLKGGRGRIHDRGPLLGLRNHLAGTNRWKYVL
jgi:hypothetical protein